MRCATVVVCLCLAVLFACASANPDEAVPPEVQTLVAGYNAHMARISTIEGSAIWVAEYSDMYLQRMVDAGDIGPPPGVPNHREAYRIMFAADFNQSKYDIRIGELQCGGGETFGMMHNDGEGAGVTGPLDFSSGYLANMPQMHDWSDGDTAFTFNMRGMDLTQRPVEAQGTERAVFRVMQYLGQLSLGSWGVSGGPAYQVSLGVPGSGQSGSGKCVVCQGVGRAGDRSRNRYCIDPAEDFCVTRAEVSVLLRDTALSLGFVHVREFSDFADADGVPLPCTATEARYGYWKGETYGWMYRGVMKFDSLRVDQQPPADFPVLAVVPLLGALYDGRHYGELYEAEQASAELTVPPVDPLLDALPRVGGAGGAGKGATQER